MRTMTRMAAATGLALGLLLGTTGLATAQLDQGLGGPATGLPAGGLLVGGPGGGLGGVSTQTCEANGGTVQQPTEESWVATCRNGTLNGSIITDGGGGEA